MQELKTIQVDGKEHVVAVPKSWEYDLVTKLFQSRFADGEVETTFASIKRLGTAKVAITGDGRKYLLA
ncbi:hypothetical protein IK112_02775 [Candidatus Saccharibacteria bacterium]|nr:hypothetical protein [Candidatus Saccharibacteria bacterium]